MYKQRKLKANANYTKKSLFKHTRTSSYIQVIYDKWIYVEVKKKIKSKGHNSAKNTCNCILIYILSLIINSMSVSTICENCCHGRKGKLTKRKEWHNIPDLIMVKHKRYTCMNVRLWAHFVYEKNGK